MSSSPTPHLDKLRALQSNPKLPSPDVSKVEEALERYDAWTHALDQAKGSGDELLKEWVTATNEYKRFIELDLIFRSSADFLYRQKGQLKIDNTVLEEFLPRLVDRRLVPGIAGIDGFFAGPQQCFAGMFVGPIGAHPNEGGVFVKSKNQDFAVGRHLRIRVSEDGTKPIGELEQRISTCYFAAEVKTNLDKTMFQEACATASELKSNVREATYVLACEWLDMPPIDTRLTAIDRVVLLRKAKRQSSAERAEYSEQSSRRKLAGAYEEFLLANPLQLSAFKMIVEMLNLAFPERAIVREDDVLSRGYF